MWDGLAVADTCEDGFVSLEFFPRTQRIWCVSFGIAGKFTVVRKDQWNGSEAGSETRLYTGTDE